MTYFFKLNLIVVVVMMLFLSTSSFRISSAVSRNRGLRMVWKAKETDQKFLIAPSILSADFARLGEEVTNVLAAGADVVHFDVMGKCVYQFLDIFSLISAMQTIIMYQT